MIPSVSTIFNYCNDVFLGLEMAGGGGKLRECKWKVSKMSILYAFLNRESWLLKGNSQKNCIFQVLMKYYKRMIKLLEFLFIEL